ncbi:MAG TPA: right-handed parallel beta-helix repeat-containing protein [Candidatus Saccharimonadales bacterium]|nr:right-handed parallel beta-helix repeat-containing protein [Candidatus Saccharimonadales bacterium]
MIFNLKSNKIFKTLIILLGLGASSILLSGHAAAVTRSVPSQYGSIQAAINASGTGDTVLVSPGTYREQLNIDGKYIELRSASGNFNDTIIAPNAGRTGIMIMHVPYRTGIPRAKISGFRITGANYVPDGQGGGITLANGADPIIENDLIDNNHAMVDGGGILIFRDSNPTIRDSYINSNTASRFGGGIFSVLNCNPVIKSNNISNNIASGPTYTGGGASGGGLYLENDTSNSASHASPVISGNTISGNSADFAGGAMSLRTGIAAIIEENTISGNHASYGGGIHVETEGAGPVISNNNIQNNTASLSGTFSGSGYGGGISVYASSTPRILHNQISGNAASRGGGGIVLAENSNSTISNNTIGSGNYVADPGTNTGGGIYISSATANVVNNVIRSNTAGIGGGIGILSNANITVTNNTIVKNQTTYTGASSAGGGVFIVDNNSIVATFKNNILALNGSHQIFEERKQATYTNNLIANDNSGLYFSYDAGSITNVNSFNGNSNINSPSGNVSGNPQFDDPNNNVYTIQSSSPAKDTGTGSGAPAEDLRRARRPFGSEIDIGAYEYTTETNFKSPVYRFWSSEYNGHFFTHSQAEKNLVLSNYSVTTWHYEFEAYDAFDTQVTSSTPVYRFYSNLYHAHFYTVDSAEKDYIIANYPDNTWHFEGTVFYVYPTSFGGSSNNNVYRFWSPTYTHHFYTASQAEHDFIVANYPPSIWTDEGIRFKVPK